MSISSNAWSRKRTFPCLRRGKRPRRWKSRRAGVRALRLFHRDAIWAASAHDMSISSNAWSRKRTFPCLRRGKRPRRWKSRRAGVRALRYSALRGESDSWTPMGSIGPQKSGRVSRSDQDGRGVTSAACQQVARSRPSADGPLRGYKHHQRPQVNQHAGRKAAE